MADPQPLRLLEVRRHRGDLVCRAGEHHRTRAVDRRDRHPVGQQRQHLRLGGPHRDHDPTGGQGLHQAASSGDQLRRVGQGQHPGDVRGGDLTDRVPDQEVRSHTERLDQPEQGHLDREQGRLRVDRLVQGLRVVGDHVADRPVEVTVQLRAGRVERLREHRERRRQLQTHTRPLRPLTGEDERELPVDHVTGHQAGIRPSLGGRVEGVPPEHHRPMGEGAARAEGVPDVGGVQSGMALQVGQQPGRLVAYTVGGGRGERPDRRPGSKDDE